MKKEIYKKINLVLDENEIQAIEKTYYITSTLYNLSDDKENDVYVNNEPVNKNDLSELLGFLEEVYNTWGVNLIEAEG